MHAVALAAKQTNTTPLTPDAHGVSAVDRARALHNTHALAVFHKAGFDVGPSGTADGKSNAAANAEVPAYTELAQIPPLPALANAIVNGTAGRVRMLVAPLAAAARAAAANSTAAEGASPQSGLVAAVWFAYAPLLLTTAVERGRPELVELVLALGASPSLPSARALELAQTAVRKFAAADANDTSSGSDSAAARAVAAVGPLLQQCERYASPLPPLHVAAQLDSGAAATALLAAGADAEVAVDLTQGRGSGVTALELAAARGAASAAAALLAGGADGSGAARAGRGCALHVAAAHGAPGAVRALVAGGVRPAERDDDGRTAVELARAIGHEDVAAEIEAAAAEAGVSLLD